RARDAAVAQSAQSFGIQTAPELLASSSHGNPQNVRSLRLPSRRDRNQPDTGITNDERGDGCGPCPLTSPCTRVTTWPTSPLASTAAAAPAPCPTTPPRESRPASGPGPAPPRSG